jgi:hypothetical protein
MRDPVFSDVALDHVVERFRRGEFVPRPQLRDALLDLQADRRRLRELEARQRPAKDPR